MPNHIHVFIGYKPHQLLPDLLQDIKGSSSGWINKKGFVKGKFRWQESYGAFSYSHSQIDRVVKYIKTQEQHHKNRTFREEYIEFLNDFSIDYNERYISSLMGLLLFNDYFSTNITSPKGLYKA